MNQPIKLTLNNGVQIPRLGLGTNTLKGQPGFKAIQVAIKAGYRLIDTAQSYENESIVGSAIAESTIPREDFFITTKINDHNQGYDATKDSFYQSLEHLQTQYVDSLLIHWPNINNFAISIETWHALIDLQSEGLAKAIGVSNFTEELIQRISDESGIVPSINQVEFHPFLFQEELLAYCRKKDIVIESYSPIARAKRTNNPVLQQLASKYDRSPVQIILRWHLEHDLVPIPRSKDPDHIKANLDVFDFSLTEKEIEKINQLDEGYRIINPQKSPDTW